MLWRAKCLVSSWVSSLELEPFQWKISIPACGEASTFDSIWKTSVLSHENRHQALGSLVNNCYLDFVPLPRLQETHRMVRNLGGYHLAFQT